eukprot:UN15075
MKISLLLSFFDYTKTFCDESCTKLFSSCRKFSPPHFSNGFASPKQSYHLEELICISSIR